MAKLLQDMSDVQAYLLTAVVAMLLLMLHIGATLLRTAPGRPIRARLFSLPMLLVFLTGFGWAGLAARLDWRYGATQSVKIAVVAGLLLTLAAWCLSHLRGRDRFGRRLPSSFLGVTGTVYRRIPGGQRRSGLVQIKVDGRSHIVRAVSQQGEIRSFAAVMVTALEPGRVVVEPHVVAAGVAG